MWRVERRCDCKGRGKDGIVGSELRLHDQTRTTHRRTAARATFSGSLLLDNVTCHLPLRSTVNASYHNTSSCSRPLTDRRLARIIVRALHAASQHYCFDTVSGRAESSIRPGGGALRTSTCGKLHSRVPDVTGGGLVPTDKFWMFRLCEGSAGEVLGACWGSVV